MGDPRLQIYSRLSVCKDVTSTVPAEGTQGVQEVVTPTVCVLCCWFARTSWKHLGLLWLDCGIFRKKKKGRKRSLKHFRSQMEQIPSRDGGTVEKPRFTVALPRGKTSFRHKPCGKLPRAADLWGQTNKKETVQVIRAEALDPCLH